MTYEIVLWKDDHRATIYRRYTDFLKLFEAIKEQHADLFRGYVFPKKCFMGNFSLEVVQERMTQFTALLHICLSSELVRETKEFLQFLQDQELEKACRLLDERKSEQALPILENLFYTLSHVFKDYSKDVLVVLCRLVAASAYPVPMPEASHWADLGLARFEKVCDPDLLQLYVPLIKACVYLFWKTGRDKTKLDAQLDGMRKRGINVKTGPTLAQAIHKLDPRTETA